MKRTDVQGNLQTDAPSTGLQAIHTTQDCPTCVLTSSLEVHMTQRGSMNSPFQGEKKLMVTQNHSITTILGSVFFQLARNKAP